MQKKAIAVVLALALAIVFAACSGKDDDPTTTFSSFTPNTSLTDPSSSDLTPSENSLQPEEQNSTIVLTTQAGETMLTVATTAFVPEAPSVVTTLPTTPDPNVPLTIPSMTAPPVNTSNSYTYVSVSPTLPTSPYRPYTSSPTSASPYVPNITTTTVSVPSSSVVPSSTTTTQPAPTTAATRSAKSVVINDIATTSDKKMVVTIDSNGWDGSFQNNSQTITVKVDGVSKSASASVRSGAKNADGHAYITIDLSELSIPEGSHVQFTVPAAFLQTSSGAQYNSAFSGAYTMM